MRTHRQRTRVRRLLSVLPAIAIVAAGCGPQHSEQEFLRANAELLSRSGGTTQTSTGSLQPGAPSPSGSATELAGQATAGPSNSRLAAGSDTAGSVGGGAATGTGTAGSARPTGGPMGAANAVANPSTPISPRAAGPGGGQNPGAVPVPST